MPSSNRLFRTSTIMLAWCAFICLPVSTWAQASVVSPAASTPPPVSASAPAVSAAKPVVTADAVAVCERAARDLLVTKGVAVTEVKFTATPSLQPRLSTDRQVVLQGTGSWRGSGSTHTFSYTCNTSPDSAEAVGMVMRDTTPASTQAPAAGSALEPDLSQLSPTVCESAVAMLLKKRWLRVSEVSFDSHTRAVKQETAHTAQLRGRGRALPEQGVPYSLFGFECQFDTRDGRLLAARLER